MSTLARLAAFAAAAAVTFGLAYLVGGVVDPLVADDEPAVPTTTIGHGWHG